MSSHTTDELSYNLGDTVDRLISVQYFMSGGGSDLARETVTGILYEAARENAGASMGLVDPFTGLAFGWDDFPVDKNDQRARH